MTTILHTYYGKTKRCQYKSLFNSMLQSQDGRRMVAELVVMSEVKQAKAVTGVYMIKFKKVMSWSQDGRKIFLLFLLKH